MLTTLTMPWVVSMRSPSPGYVVEDDELRGLAVPQVDLDFADHGISLVRVAGQPEVVARVRDSCATVVTGFQPIQRHSAGTSAQPGAAAYPAWLTGKRLRRRRGRDLNPRSA
jgi:hypothetical protein